MINAVREFIQTCPFLSDFSPNGVLIDWTDSESDYGIECTGDSLVQGYVGGAQKRAATYVLYARGWTVEDKNRLDNNQFCDRFMQWVIQQSRAGVLPALPAGREAQKMEASNGLLLSYDDPSTGIYQIQIRMIYTMEV